MTPELIAIIGTGIALAVVIVPGQRAMRRDLANLEKGMLERMSNLEVRMLERMTKLEKEMLERMTKLEAELRERIAHLEGVVEGLVRQRQQEGAPKV
ncbi:MAG: hypothetical protein F4Y86_18095 [Gammaproteobacteria bacterium]|nr:hypothetical protein [Gammaproteobacteria bacterium]